MSFLVKQLMKSAVGHAASGRAESATTAGVSSSAHAPPTGPSHAATVRTLMLRVETCQVAQDRRDALQELLGVEDVGHYLTGQHTETLLRLAKHFLGTDADSTRMILEIFSAATDPNSPRASQREIILEQLVDVPFFLGFLDDGNFWVKYHAVQLLQRIEETSTMAVHKQLLATHGLHAIIDVLNDESNGGALRNEGLVLLTALTATDQELQTIIAFENGFDSLFQIINEEGGLNGGVVATDCLSTITNILRGNNATQKFFREMGCARNLSPILSAVAPPSSALHEKHDPKSQSLEPFSQMLNPDSSLILQRTISVLQCLLKGADMNNDATAIRNALLQCGVIVPLATVAFSTHRVDSSNQIEAMRTLAMLLSKSKACCDAFSQSRIPQRWTDQWFVGSGIWAVLRWLVSSNDGATQTACMSVLQSLMDTPGCSITVGSLLMKNLTKPPTSSVAMPHNDAAHCGPLFAAALFGCLNQASSSATYYTAVMLHHILMVPQIAEHMLHLVWDASAGLSFFSAYVKHVSRLVQLKQTDLCTIAALLRPLFTWFMYTSKAVLFALQEDGILISFLDWSLQTRDSVHTRFLCLCLGASIVVATPAVTPGAYTKPIGGTTRVGSSNGLAETALADKSALLKIFCTHTVNGKRLKDLYSDVEQSDDWKEAPAVAALSSPTIYDASFKSLLTDVIQQVSLLIEKNVVPPHAPQREASPGQSASLSIASPRSSSPENGLAHVEMLPPSISGVSVPPHSGSTSVLPQRHDVGTPPPPPPLGTGSSNSTTHVVDDHIVPLDVAPGSHLQHRTVNNRERDEDNARLLAELDSLKQLLRARDSELSALRHSTDNELDSLRKESRQAHNQLADMIAKKAQLEAQHIETVTLLEDALHNKEEEARALASSLSMLESRLNASVAEASQAQEFKSMLDVAALERDELLILVAEMDEEREINRAMNEASAISPPRTATDVDVSPVRGSRAQSDVE